jgi:hypothetical protein
MVDLVKRTFDTPDDLMTSATARFEVVHLGGRRGATSCCAAAASRSTFSGCHAGRARRQTSSTCSRW